MTTDTSSGKDFDPDKEQERLDRLEQNITETRNRVEDEASSMDSMTDDQAKRFVDSGDTGDEFDDQVIAPPA